MDLQESWRVTTKHLEAAASHLPPQPHSNPEGRSIEGFQDWLSHNGLELALDELEGLGVVNACPIEFWEELLAASKNMGLLLHAARYRARLSQEG